MNIKPLGARVLVKREVAEAMQKSEGGILLDTSKMNQNYFKGEVVAVGHIPNVDVKEGNKVAFLKYGYEDMGDDLCLVEEGSLLAVYA